MSTQDLARALAARLEPDQPDDPETGTPVLSARVAEEELVAELATLAERLTELPSPPAPSSDFRAALAARLSAAPSPSSIAPSTAAPASDTVRQAEASPLPTTRELSRALDDALTRLGQGASPANLERELGPAGEELAPLLDLATALRDAPEAPAPEPDFRAALGARLAAAPTPRSLAPVPVPGSGWLRRLWRSTAFTAAAAATIVLFLVAGVTYASADAMPGAPLYPVKRTAERARLWLATDAQALALHMSFAELRLAEALVEPGHAGAALADFSREVTAALAVADGALAAGAERAAVTEPLLQWLLASRGELIAHREGLPAMAWRVALAQVDAAIAALRAGRPLADRPVPRLHDPVAVLALRADDTFPAGWARALPRPVAPGGDEGSDDGDETAATSELVALAMDGTAPESQDPAVGAESSEPAPESQDPVAPPAGNDPGGTNPPSGGGDDGGGDGGGGSDPAPTEKPTSRPTQKPEPTAEPTKAPPTEPPATNPPPASPTSAPLPTDPPAPVLPTEPPASPTPPPLIPTVPPAPPTSEPSPTATAAPVVPASIEVVCTPNTLLPAGRADCGIEISEEIPADWTVEWVASLGTIEAPHPERPEDRRWARYEATNSLQGVDKVYATVHATLRDAAGNEVSGSTIIYIVPRLDDSVSPPGENLAPGVSDG